jgi:5-methylcytosine-specific restriction endonuclease McrA
MVQTMLGAEGVLAVMDLWNFATGSKTDGDLSGMTDLEIEMAAGWVREGELIAAMTKAKLLDGPPGERRIHDWADHNPWVAGHKGRSTSARKAARAKWGKGKTNAKKRSNRLTEARKKGSHTKEEWLGMLRVNGPTCCRCGRDDLPLEKDHIVPIYRGGSDGIDNIQPVCAGCNAAKGPEHRDCRSSLMLAWVHDACGMPANACGTPAPSPSPSPSPKPSPKKPRAPRAVSRSGGVDLVWAHYHKLHPRTLEACDDKQARLVTARLKEGFTAEQLCQAIDGYHRSPFHCGENDHKKKYLALSLILRDASKVQAGLEMAEGTAEKPPTLEEYIKRFIPRFAPGTPGGGFLNPDELALLDQKKAEWQRLHGGDGDGAPS